MSEVLIPVVVILLMVAANALYVAAEFATVGSRRARVQEAAEAGQPAAKGLLRILRDPRRLDTYVAACQIGITLSSLVAGAYGQARLTPLFAQVLGPVGGAAAAVVAVLIVVTTLQVVLGELLPKTIALRYPERLALATLRPMQASLWLFRPLIALFNGTAFRVMRWMGLNPEQSHSHVHSPEELEGLYRESAAGGLIDAAERDMLAGALNVDERLVREIMTPRTRLVMAAADEPVAVALERLARTPYSRFPVTGTDSDDILGMVHLRVLFASADSRPRATLEAVMRPPLVVADVMSVPVLWKTLHDAGRHSAIVVNEFGSVVGMVTLEDALEEIFGELQDEFDQEDEPVLHGGDRVSVRGDVLVDVLNARFGLDLPSDDADTVGGLIWHELGHLPVEGEEVAVGGRGIVLRVDAMERRAVRRASFHLPGGSR